jgi:hypothetical protein
MPTTLFSWLGCHGYDMHINTARITVAEQRGLIPLAQGQDVQCYNYSLPYKFGSVPEVAIGKAVFLTVAVHDF